MILKALDALGPLHGYGIARRLEQISEDIIKLNEGTVYASLLRLGQKRWIAAEWGASENNRKAKFYSITKAGRRQLASEAENWDRISSVIGRVLKLESCELADANVAARIGFKVFGFYQHSPGSIATSIGNWTPISRWLTEKFVREGITQQEASCAARRQFGGIAHK